MRRCVITGVGPVTPIGIGKEEFWNALVNAKSNYSQITRFALEPWDKIRIAAQINGFEPRKYISGQIVAAIEQQEAQNGGLSIYYAIAGAKLAIADAKLDLTAIDTARVGVIVGSGAADLGLLQRATTDFTRGVFSLANAHAGIIAKECGFHGLTQAVSGACATGNLTVRSAYQEIASGTHDIIIAGAAESPIDIPLYLGSPNYRKEGVKGLSQANNGMFPFDQKRDGAMLSEGAGILILEEREHALKRGARIYAEVVGSGYCTDFGENLVRVTQRGYEEAMRMAMQSINRDGAIYVNAHGTATLLNDKMESQAIRAVFGERTPVSSFKGTLGHPQAAASAIELIGCALVLYNGVIPASNLQEIAPDCAPLDYVKEKRAVALDLVVKNAAGFNGVYATIVLARHE